MKIVLTLSLMTMLLLGSKAEAQSCTGAGDAAQLYFTSDTYRYCDGSAWVETDNGPTSTSSVPCTIAEAAQLKYSGSILRYCNGQEWRSMKGVSNGSCAGQPAGAYKYVSGAYQFCDGTTWYKMAQNPPTGAVGYFVRSRDQHNGNFGGLAGADAWCLSQLTTYPWWGKADATARGLLVAAKVKAFMCDSTTCNNTTASTSYIFAHASVSAQGGAWFTTDASGRGPGDSSPWNVTQYFNGGSTYHGARTFVSATLWGTTTANASHCNNWSDATTGFKGRVGSSGQVDDKRWNTGSGSDDNCNTSNYVICLVNP